MALYAVAELIARTMCECDGKAWADIAPAEQERYVRIGILAEHRIRLGLLDGRSRGEIVQALTVEPGHDGTHQPWPTNIGLVEGDAEIGENPDAAALGHLDPRSCGEQP